MMVIGAHSADFVWRAGGAVAVTTAGGGEASRDRAVLRRARRVRRAVERGRPDDRERQEDPPRRGRARRGGARRVVRLPRPRRLSARDRRRRPAADLRQDPRVRARRADHAHRHRPVQPRSPDRPLRGRPGPGAGRRRGCRERVHDDQPAGAVPVRAPPAGAVQLHPDHVRRHHERDRREARRDVGDEGAEVPPDLLRRARRPSRQPRAPLVGQRGHPAGRGVPARHARRW